jgi:hypothetical protein
MKLSILVISLSMAVFAADPVEYRVLATTKTSTMEKEMNEAAGQGFEYASVMGGETAFGGKEVVVVMEKSGSTTPRRYRLLATSRTSTMQKEMQELGDEGFEYKGQTVFISLTGGREVAIIMELDSSKGKARIEYRLLATSKTSTLDKELAEAGKEGFHMLGMSVGKTLLGGSELVSIMRKK